MDFLNLESQKLMQEFPMDRTFDSIETFANAFKLSACAKGILFKVKQRNKKSICFACPNNNCNFCVRANYNLRLGYVEIKFMQPVHCCGVLNVKAYTIGGLVSKTLSKIEKTPQLLQAKMKTQYGLDIKYSTAWAAIKNEKIKTRQIISDWARYLPSLLVKFENHGLVHKLDILDGKFKRVCICWNATKSLYRHIRKIITIDGTFLSGPTRGTMLTAVAQDGLNELILLAFSIVEGENACSWAYFLEFLNEHFQINSNETIIISDRDKGIICAMSAIIPEVNKLHCLRHLAHNLKFAFKNSTLIKLFWAAANTIDESEFENIMKSVHAINPAFHGKLVDAKFECWASSKQKIMTFGKNTSNAAESMDSALKKKQNKRYSKSHYFH